MDADKRLLRTCWPPSQPGLSSKFQVGEEKLPQKADNARDMASEVILSSQVLIHYIPYQQRGWGEGRRDEYKAEARQKSNVSLLSSPWLMSLSVASLSFKRGKGAMEQWKKRGR